MTAQTVRVPWTQAYRVLKEMQEAKCRPNHMTFHHLIFGWGKCGDPVAALGVLEVSSVIHPMR